MASLRDPLCETFINLQMGCMEFFTAEQAFEIAREEGAYPEHETDESVLAHLARSRAYCLGEWIANEYETPDCDREDSDGSLITSRQQAISRWWSRYHSAMKHGDYEADPSRKR